MYQIRLKEIMKAKGIRQKELAERLGVTVQYVNGIASGRLGVSISRLYDITRALGVSITDVLKEDSAQATIICPHCGKPIIFETEKAKE